MKFFNNFKNPKGKLGNTIINQMNEKNAKVAVWGINHLDIKKSDIILDIGCGGGTNIKRMAGKTPEGKVYGVDYSTQAVERSAEYNQSLISQGKAEIIEASVSNLPFEDETFDVITAIKTVFFWPDLLNDFKEVKRVLKNDGVFAIIVDYNGADGKKMMKIMEGLMEMDAKSDTEITDILLKAGYGEVTSYVRNIASKKETVKRNNVKEDEIADTFKGGNSPSDKMAEWICLMAQK